MHFQCLELGIVPIKEQKRMRFQCLEFGIVPIKEQKRIHFQCLELWSSELCIIITFQRTFLASLAFP